MPSDRHQCGTDAENLRATVSFDHRVAPGLVRGVATIDEAVRSPGGDLSANSEEVGGGDDRLRVLAEDDEGLPSKGGRPS